MLFLLHLLVAVNNIPLIDSTWLLLVFKPLIWLVTVETDSVYGRTLSGLATQGEWLLLSNIVGSLTRSRIDVDRLIGLIVINHVLI